MFEDDELPVAPMRLPNMSVAELGLFCDLLNGTLFSPNWTAENLILEIHDGEECFRAVTRWGIDPKALVQRVSNWKHAEVLGVLGFVHVFWRGPDRQHGERIRE